jgi:hypothetical protein
MGMDRTSTFKAMFKEYLAKRYLSHIERYALFMEIVSNYITAPIGPRKRYILRYLPDSCTC